MKKRIFVAITVVALLLCLAASVLAASTIKLVLNGKEFKTAVSPKVVNKKALALVRGIAEPLGATVTWDDKNKTLLIEAKEMEAQKTQMLRLEEALTPKDPLTAAKTWAEGVKTRNGAMQYVVMSSNLRKEFYKQFMEANWSTGVSSPWIESYKVTEKYKVDKKMYRFEVEFTYTDSTKEKFFSKEYITVNKIEDNWLLSSIEKIEAKGEITKVTLEEDKKVKSIFVQDKTGERGSYDQASVIIDHRTRIFKGYTDRELRASDLHEGAKVEVAFTDEPRIMIYPVSAPAKTIRMMETEDNTVVYRNTQYDFSFSLPDSWKDYMLVLDKWEGYSLKEGENGKIVETGPILSLRHPEWTAKNPRQDIPIMVFTLTQWGLLQQEKFHIGAAPMGPSELGRNNKYVFALPARYNYAFPTGYEEVESILRSNPLKTD
jgi:acid phosphatase class B